MRNADVSAVLGSASKLTGRVQGTGGLVIEGTLKGGAALSGPCEITESGAVDGDIDAESLEVSGTLNGDVVSSGPVVVRAGASARGAVRCERIVIEPGARVAVRVESDFDLEPPRRRR